MMPGSEAQARIRSRLPYFDDKPVSLNGAQKKGWASEIRTFPSGIRR
jgi:hypothetical protein